jgi:hypothetical protein
MKEFINWWYGTSQPPISLIVILILGAISFTGTVIYYSWNDEYYDRVPEISIQLGAFIFFSILIWGLGPLVIPLGLIYMSSWIIETVGKKYRDNKNK